MSKEIEIAVKREITHIQQLCDAIMCCPKSEGLEILDEKTRRDLCDRIFVDFTRDAENIRCDANFAVNKLSESLERMTKMVEEKEKIIRDLCCRAPRRNCERFNSGNPSKDMENSWIAFRETHKDDTSTEAYERWLFEPIAPIAFKKPEEEGK